MMLARLSRSGTHVSDLNIRSSWSKSLQMLQLPVCGYRRPWCAGCAEEGVQREDDEPDRGRGREQPRCINEGATASRVLEHETPARNRLAEPQAHEGQR